MEYFKDALTRYAEFTGRATRRQFWMYILFYLIFYIVTVVIDSILGIGLISTLYSLGLLIPSLAIGCRRLHDINMSGWWQLLMLIPILGTLVLIYFYVQPSREDNQFGPRIDPATV